MTSSSHETKGVSVTRKMTERDTYEMLRMERGLTLVEAHVRPLHAEGIGG